MFASVSGRTSCSVIRPSTVARSFTWETLPIFPRRLMPKFRSLVTTPLLAAPAPGTQQFLPATQLRDLLVSRGIDVRIFRSREPRQFEIGNASRTARILWHSSRFQWPSDATNDEAAVVEAIKQHLTATTGHADWQVDVDFNRSELRNLAKLGKELEASAGPHPLDGSQRFQLASVGSSEAIPVLGPSGSSALRGRDTSEDRARQSDRRRRRGNSIAGRQRSHDRTEFSRPSDWQGSPENWISTRFCRTAKFVLLASATGRDGQGFRPHGRNHGQHFCGGAARRIARRFGAGSNSRQERPLCGPSLRLERIGSLAHWGHDRRFRHSQPSDRDSIANNSTKIHVMKTIYLLNVLVAIAMPWRTSGSARKMAVCFCNRCKPRTV